jgi:hypothetical protein
MVALMDQYREGEEKLDEAVEDMRSDAEEMQERSEELGDRIEHTFSCYVEPYIASRGL